MTETVTNELAILEAICQKLPTVERSFILDVASFSREELQRRVLIQSDWIGHFSRCLDGIKEIQHISGGGCDRARQPENIRAVVMGLLKP